MTGVPLCVKCDAPTEPGHLLCPACGKRKAKQLERKQKKQSQIMTKRKPKTG